MELLAAGKLATRSMGAKMAASGLHMPHTMVAFYNACVRSIYSYGAQVWSTSFLTADFDAAMEHGMVAEQRAFLRSVVGAQRPCNQLLFMELSQLPMQHHWAGLVFRFWNRMARQRDTLCHSTFRSDIRLALEWQVGWTHDDLTFLRSLPGLPGSLKLPNHARLSHDQLVEAYSRRAGPFYALLLTNC